MAIKSKLIILLVIMILSFPNADGAFRVDDTATSSAQFLKMGAGARASGMGNAFVAMSNDASAIYWNPAGLTQIKRRSILVMHSVLLKDITYDWFSYVEPTRYGNLGIGVQYLNYGIMKEIDETGLEIGNFNPSDTSITLSYSKNIFGLLVGLSAKQIISKIKNTANAVAYDMGLIYKVMDDKLAIGCMVQNYGTTLKYQDVEETLPLSGKIGLSYAIKDNITLNLDSNSPQDGEPNYNAGLEYTTIVTYDLGFAVRVGYATITKNIGGLTGLTAGVGVNYMDCTLDYAFLPFGELGDTHRLSLGYRF